MDFVPTHFCNDLRLNWTLRNTSSSLPFFKAIGNKYKVFCKKSIPHFMCFYFSGTQKITEVQAYHLFSQASPNTPLPQVCPHLYRRCEHRP